MAVGVPLVRMPAQAVAARRTGVLRAIADFVQTHGYPPTVREIGKACGIPTTSVVAYHLNYLEARGWLERDRDARGAVLARALRITPAGRAALTVNFHGHGSIAHE